jgi:hypothetical protein
MLTLREIIDFYFHGRHRLEAVKWLPLGSSVDDAIELYGPPIEVGPSEETADVKQLTFAVGAYHDAILLEWKQTIQSITYWSLKSDPARDLRSMLDRYGGGHDWRVIEEGYWYQRNDDLVRLWCSAAPAIGVAFVEFLGAMADYKRAHNVSKLNELDDLTWAPYDAISELQRRFVENESAKLIELASRSERIAVSPDGRHVVIVRNHQVYEVEAGFGELNSRAEGDEGPSTQVINLWSWSEDGSSWGKTVLPRNAAVELIRFEGEQCCLQIRHIETNRVLRFRRPAPSITGLVGSFPPYNDQALWSDLEGQAEAQNESDK